MDQEQRGSILTACGSVWNAPLYQPMPSGLPVLYFTLRCENPSGKSAHLQMVSYGAAARDQSRTLARGQRLFVVGTLQTRQAGKREVTEVVCLQTRRLDGPGATSLMQRYGAQATLLGEIKEGPYFTLLGVEKTPFTRFTAQCANPKGHDARLTVVHFGSLAATYATTLDTGMQVLVAAEPRTHLWLPPGAPPHSAVTVLQFVTDTVEVVATQRVGVAMQRVSAALPLAQVGVK